MFSTTPRTLPSATCRKLTALRTSASEISCGVVTTTLWASVMVLRMVICSSPVPGGESMSRKSRGPQATSERNWRMAAVFLGPRHRMAWSRSCRKESMEMTARFSLYMAGMSSFFSFISMVAFRPSRLGTLGPCMSTSRMPTLKPRWARAAAVLTVTELLPTPPLPLMTKILCRMWARRSAMIWS